MYIDFNREYNNEGSKLKIGDNVRVSKWKKCFCKRLHCKLVWEIFCS